MWALEGPMVIKYELRCSLDVSRRRWRLKIGLIRVAVLQSQAFHKLCNHRTIELGAGVNSGSHTDGHGMPLRRRHVRSLMWSRLSKAI